MDKSVDKKFIILLLVICVIFLILVIAGFVVFNNREAKVVDKSEHGAKIVLNYTSDMNGFKIKKLNPTTDEVGIADMKEENYLDFSVEVKLDNATKVEYEIALVKDAINSTVLNDDVRIYLEKENSGTYTKVFGPDKFVPSTKKSRLGASKGSMVLVTTRKTNSQPDNYRLRIWASDKSTVQDGTYSVILEVKGRAY